MTHTQDFVAVMNAFAAHAAKDMDRLYLAAVRCAAETGHVTTDDLRGVELTAPERDKRIYGGALAQLARKHVLVIVGEKQTHVKGSNGRPIKVFALAGDWRSRWMSDDRLPVPSELVNLATPRAGAEVGQKSADEIFAVLAEVNRLARTGIEDPLQPALDALRRIRDLTKDWGQKHDQRQGTEAAGS
jgi:hypothetical protein